MNTPESAPLRPQRLNATALSLGLLAVIAVGAVLKAAQGVVIPLLIAWLLSYLLAPAVTFLVRRLRFPAPLAVAGVTRPTDSAQAIASSSAPCASILVVSWSSSVWKPSQPVGGAIDCNWLKSSGVAKRETAFSGS